MKGIKMLTLQAERFRRHVSHGKEFRAEYSVVKLCCDGRRRSPCSAMSEQGTGRQQCHGLRGLMPFQTQPRRKPF